MEVEQDSSLPEPRSGNEGNADAYPDTLYVHTIDLKDVGLVWSNQIRRSNSRATAPEASPAAAAVAAFEEDAQEAAAMQALGLPIAFGSEIDPAQSQPSSSRRTAPRAMGAAWAGGAPVRPRSYSSAPAEPTHEWHQALDPATGHYYYYCEALQATQWDPPPEGYRPASEAWWLPQDTLNGHGESKDAMKGIEEDKNGESAAVAPVASPYDLAVSSYRSMQGKGAAGAGTAEISIQQRREKPKVRIETSGLLPEIPAPDPRQHIRFSGSSSSSEEEEEEEMEEVSASQSEIMDVSGAEEEAPTPGSDVQQQQQRRRRRRKRRSGGPPPSAGLPRSLHKYWLQRYSLFSRFDEGISIDPGGWYSVTPEVVAWHHAKRAAAAATVPITQAEEESGALNSRTRVAVDAFGGVGGNAVQLALTGLHVIAIEMDPGRAAALAHNAGVYGVAPHVEVLCTDFLQAAPTLQADVALLSPPWGGPEYAKSESFDVEDMGGCPHLGLTALLRLAFGPMGCRGAVAWLPRNSSLDQVHAAAAVVPEGLGKGLCEVEITRLNGVVKAITAYYGTAVRRRR